MIHSYERRGEIRGNEGEWEWVFSVAAGPCLLVHSSKE